jgi:methyl-accepting chemotaxis protein
MLISFITIIFGISCGIFVRIIITRAFNSCISISETIASGDLTSTISEAGNDEAAQLRRSMSVMQERMRDSLSIITDSVFSITTSSKQLAGSTTEIATATEEVSAQINMIATATEEMSATSMEIAQSVHYVADDATKSMKIIDTNADTMKSTIFIMEDIARRINASAEIISRLVTSSDEIGTIINTIEDIADQTKLLALNAAIEAARAGEHGMGFAVVADEVKALAERTTNATSEIGTMIKTIQKETKTAVDSIEAGVKRAGEGTVEASKSKEALDEMSSRTHSTMEQVNHVATAAEEQNATTREIAENMQGILTAVSETSGRLSEITNVSKVLSKMADDLGSTVKKFRI